MQNTSQYFQFEPLYSKKNEGEKNTLRDDECINYITDIYN